MIEIPENVKEINDMSWDSLRNMAISELATIPVRDHIAFETVFRLKWPEFQNFILSLIGKTYKVIKPIENQMSMLGDFSAKEVLELSLIGTLNEFQLKSAKIEFYLICRALHTKKH